MSYNVKIHFILSFNKYNDHIHIVFEFVQDSIENYEGIIDDFVWVDCIECKYLVKEQFDVIYFNFVNCLNSEVFVIKTYNKRWVNVNC